MDMSHMAPTSVGVALLGFLLWKVFVEPLFREDVHLNIKEAEEAVAPDDQWEHEQASAEMNAQISDQADRNWWEERDRRRQDDW